MTNLQEQQQQQQHKTPYIFNAENFTEAHQANLNNHLLSSSSYDSFTLLKQRDMFKRLADKLAKYINDNADCYKLEELKMCLKHDLDFVQLYEKQISANTPPKANTKLKDSLVGSLWIRESKVIDGIVFWLCNCSDCNRYCLLPESFLEDGLTDCCRACTLKDKQLTLTQFNAKLKKSGVDKLPAVTAHFKSTQSGAVGSEDTEAEVTRSTTMQSFSEPTEKERARRLRVDYKKQQQELFNKGLESGLETYGDSFADDEAFTVSKPDRLTDRFADSYYRY